jgi:hypothetical protein
LNHYNDQEKIEALLELGDLSKLGSMLGEKHDFDDSLKDECTAYGRDRGESNTEKHFCNNKEELIVSARSYGVAYTYLFEDETWYVFMNKQWQKLNEVIG